jgi:hypothetical protein
MSSASTINGNEKVVRIIDYYLNYSSPQGQIKTMARPRGAKAREPYKNFDGESQLSESITSFHIGKAWLGGCFFGSFSSRRRNEQKNYNKN